MSKVDTIKKAPPKADEWRPVFLRFLRDTANVRLACQQAGITRQAAYKSRAASTEFAAEWDSAIEDACDLLEGVAYARAQASSDTLLIFLLKAHRPEKYRETVRNELTGKDGAALSFAALVQAATNAPE